MSQFFIKNISSIPLESAHGGAGSRQLLLSAIDSISQNLEAMTKGFLPVGSAFDWHEHKNIDEVCIVLQGTGLLEFEDDIKHSYKQGDLMYFPENKKHKITNTGTIENEFYFIRINN